MLGGAYDGGHWDYYSVDSFWKDFLTTNGLDRALATTGPVLVIHGGLDWEFPAHHAQDLATGLTDAGRAVTLYEDPALGHRFQPAAGGLAVGNEYGLQYAFDPGVLDAVADFVGGGPGP